MSGYRESAEEKAALASIAAKTNARRLEEIGLGKFFQAEQIFNLKYPTTVAQNFKTHEEVNWNTHQSSEYALARSSRNAAGEQINIDETGIEPYVVFEFMRLMTEKKKAMLKDWRSVNVNYNMHTEAMATKFAAAAAATEGTLNESGEEERNFILGQEHQELLEAAGDNTSMFSEAVRDFKGSIAMYMPTDIQINDTVGYSEKSRQVSAALEGGFGKDKINTATVFNPTVIAGAGGGLNWLAKAAGKSKSKIISGSSITKWLGKGNVGLASLLGYGVGGVLSDEMQRHHGNALNPNEYMAYENTPMRTFSFVFNFLPDSIEESISATAIIKEFRMAAHADKTDNLTVRVPDHCIVSFHGAQDMIQLPPVVIESVSVTYNPNNTSFFKHNNSPVEINLSVGFKEIAPIFKDDVERGF